jgi:hypothetical protein
MSARLAGGPHVPRRLDARHNGLYGIANQSGEGVEHLQVIALGFERSL